jgi:methylmalonyl-CoA mutase cobalamin-binding subunit
VHQASGKLAIDRDELFPDGLPDGRAALTEGRALASSVTVQRCPFLDLHDVASEAEFKRRSMASGRLMFHAQIGYRDPEQSRRAWAEIHDMLAAEDSAPDRYGICLDWSMGYPVHLRRDRPRGTGLILDKTEDFRALTQIAPVAPHFGDFVMGAPAALENTAAALQAGATIIGNLGQYFTFRLPHWDDDVETTLATVRALGLIAAQETEVLVHSNLDDGFAAWFSDLASALGAALIECYVVEELIGARITHCFGHTFGDPVTRLAFQRALADASPAPGSMLYGNTTAYGASDAANYGALAGYLLIDLIGQATKPSGHAVNPVPVTEAQRIPTPQEVVAAHRAGRRLADKLPGLLPLFDETEAIALVPPLLAGAQAFRARTLDALDSAGIDIRDPAQVLLAIRRLGAHRLERLAGGAERVLQSPHASEMESAADRLLARLDADARERLRRKGAKICTASTDVHFYGKRLMDMIGHRAGLTMVDGGISTDPDDLADILQSSGAQALVLATYNGVALSYVQRLKAECAARNLDVAIYVGGRLNEIMSDTGSNLPVDVENDLRQTGAVPCADLEELMKRLSAQ